MSWMKTPILTKPNQQPVQDQVEKYDKIKELRDEIFQKDEIIVEIEGKVVEKEDNIHDLKRILLN